MEAQTTGALDYNVVAFSGLSPNQAGGYRAHGAVHRPQDIVVQLVRHLEEGMSVWQVQVIGVGGGEVRPHSGGGVVAVHAPVGVPLEALAAVIAGENGSIDYAVSLLDRRSGGIGLHAFAQDLNNAGALVAHGPSRGRQGQVLLSLVAAPGVEVRATNTGLSHA